MGHTLFWLEAAITSVLFIALGLSLVSDPQQRGSRWMVKLVTYIVIILLTFVAFFTWQEYSTGGTSPHLYLPFDVFLLALTVMLIFRDKRWTRWLEWVLTVVFPCFLAVSVAFFVLKNDRVGAGKNAIVYISLISIAYLLASYLLARLRHPRQFPWLVWTQLVLLSWILIIAGFAAVEIWMAGAVIPLISSVTAFMVFVIASTLIIRYGTKSAPESNVPRAATWRLNRLTLAWAVAFLFTSMTLWNLYLDVSSQMATKRVEAGTIANSLAPAQVPDALNAAVIYQHAAEVLDDRQTEMWTWQYTVGKWMPSRHREFNPDDEKMLAFLQKNEPVVEFLHKAADRPACNFGTQFNPPSVGILLPHLSYVRGLGNLLYLSARVKAYQGNMQGAMKDLNALFSLADHCSSQPLLITTIVAIGLETEAFETLQYIVKKGGLPKEALDQLRLNPHLNFKPALQNGIRMEKALGIWMFTNPHPSEMVSSKYSWVHVLIETIGKIPYRVFLWEKDMELCLDWMEKQEKFARQFYVYSQKWKQFETEIKKKLGILGYAFMPAFSRAAELTAAADASHRLALLAVAMLEYRLEEGSFPDQLDQLTPKYMTNIPRDPFSWKQLNMIKSDGHTIIYSIGEDLKDDGGKPWDDKERKGDLIFKLDG